MIGPAGHAPGPRHRGLLPALRRVAPLLVLALAGCAHVRPAPIDPAAAAAALTARRLDQPGLVRFLDAMGEPPHGRFGLRALTLVAVYERPDLRIRTTEADVAAGQVVRARQLPNPTLSLSPTFNATQPVPSPIKVGPVIQFLVANFGARQAGIAAARAREAAARDVIAAAAWRERSAVRDALLTLWLDRRAARLQRLAAREAGQAQALIAQRATAGMLAETVLARAGAAADRARFAAAEAAGRIGADRARLAAAIGMPAAALRGVSLSFAAFAHPSAPAPDRWPALVRAALTARPQVAAALARYRAADDALRQAVDSQFPGISIGPGYHYDQGDSKFILSLSLPLPVLNQHQGQIAIARAQRRLAAARFERAQARVLAQIDAAAAAWRGSRDTLLAARRLDAIAARRAAQAAQAYRLGATGRLRLVEAEGQAILAREQLLTAEGQRLRALAALADALHHRVFREVSA